ncbi:hypothetical protein BJ742DRAFT_802468 [Cladochytrium replicatum]|nr:hypothetical protein BJ742DRAFT_802468 [Cladochytrium replicatum]
MSTINAEAPAAFGGGPPDPVFQSTVIITVSTISAVIVLGIAVGLLIWHLRRRPKRTKHARRAAPVLVPAPVGVVKRERVWANDSGCASSTDEQGDIVRVRATRTLSSSQFRLSTPTHFGQAHSVSPFPVSANDSDIDIACVPNLSRARTPAIAVSPFPVSVDDIEIAIELNPSRAGTPA